MLNSVGPYRLSMRRPTAHCAVSSGPDASPATASTRRSGSSRGSMVASTEGVMTAWLTRRSRSSRSSSGPP
ncbi:Uncharacterised protein [Mycobacteroides abscessus subsp. abscessus]|nr:Uncharacterised protein [Mycobacteroides abscessus subsp. abscessus]